MARSPYMQRSIPPPVASTAKPLPAIPAVSSSPFCRRSYPCARLGNRFTSSPTQSITASFRDPAGSLLHYQGRILRIVNPLGAADLEAFLASPSGRKLMASGAVVPTRALDPAECRALLADPCVRQLYDARGGQIILEHERVDFPRSEENTPE